MASERKSPMTAGGEPPAVSVPDRWVDWRDRPDRPLYAVTLWPYCSLTPRMRKTVLGGIAGGLSMPLLAVAGKPVFWGLLPFVGMAVGLLWLGFRRSDRDRRLVEELTLWRDEMRVERREPSGRCLRWTAEPLKVRLRLRAEPIENYLTLTGGGREIELGAFLSPPERVALMEDIEAALTRALRA